MALTRPRYSQIYDTDYKQSVRVATTEDVGNLLTTGSITNSVDGVTVSNDDRVLVKNQSDAKQNGIYRVVTAGTGSNGTWIRALDADANTKITSGMTTTVSEGNYNLYKTFKLASPDPIYVGISELTFVDPFAAGAAAGANTQIQFNSDSSIDASANLTFDKSTNTLTVAGNIETTSGYFVGNGSQLTGITTDSTSITSGTSNAKAYYDGNISVTISGTSNVAVFTTSGLDITGNVSADNLIGNLITASGGIEGALYAENSILYLESGTSNVATYSSGNVAVSIAGTPNVVVVTDSSVSIAGNVSADNLIGNLISATGSVEGALFVENSILNLESGTSNVRIYNDNDIAISAGGTANLAVFTSSNIYVSGSILPTANVTYDLGSPTERFREGWFSGSTIHIGTESISVDGSGTWTFTSAGAAVEMGAAAAFNPPEANISGNVTAANFYFANNVSLVSLVGNAIVTANTAMKDYVDGGLSTKAESLNPSFTGLLEAENLTVSGNLIISGNTTTINTESLQINDALLYLSEDNPSDFLDIGLVSTYTKNSVYQHTGLVRDATDGVWKLFENVESEPTTVVDFGGAAYSSLKVGNLITVSAATIGSNLKLTGALLTSADQPGDSGQYLTSTGSGIAWTTIEFNSDTIKDATEVSNVVVTSSDVNIWVDGVNSTRFYNNIAYVYTSLTASGNVTAPYFVGNAEISSLVIEGNVSQGAANYTTNQYVLWGTTSSESETEIFISGQSGVRVPVGNNTTVLVEVSVIARRTDATGESASWHLKGCADNFAGTTADVGDVYEVIVARDDATWLADVRADNTNDSISVYVSGAAGKTIRWTAVVKTIEVSQ